MQTLHEWQDVLERLFFLTERLLVFDGINDVFSHILRTACVFIKADAASIQVFDLKTGRVVTVQGEGLSEEFLKQADEQIGEGIAGRVVIEGKPFFSDDVTEEFFSDHRRQARADGLKTAMAVPLKTKAGAVGCLTVFRMQSRPFDDNALLLLSIFAAIAAEAIEKRSFIQSIQQQNIFDHATGLYNRRMLLKLCDAHMNLAFRHDHAASFIVVKIDDYEDYVSLNGQLLTDKLQRDFAKFLMEQCRSSDIIGRLNEELFVMMLPHSVKAQAVTLCTKLRSYLAEQRPLGISATAQPLTFSAGISAYPDDGDTVHSLIKKAEAALATGSVAGRDATFLWHEKGLRE
ncbi:MAG TPA: sensor domain-containing diguanylate cyclase [Dissulfurispiraceae bacterium]|nr:sensor domain-containing diguanylate cyclase [Dissulfurispiraceae bacterium]